MQTINHFGNRNEFTSQQWGKEASYVFILLSLLAGRKFNLSNIFTVLLFPKYIQEFWELKGHETLGKTSVLASIMATNEIRPSQAWVVFWRVSGFVAHRIHPSKSAQRPRNLLDFHGPGPYSSFLFPPWTSLLWFLPFLKALFGTADRTHFKISQEYFLVTKRELGGMP